MLISKLPAQIKICHDLESFFEVKAMPKIRILKTMDKQLLNIAIDKEIYCEAVPLCNHGRVELLNYLDSQSLSIDYHRYGNSDQQFILD